ncbi:BadF/BadG/BcrA/BcrD ATPase family protein [Nitratireductor kimnyeongensis]|uniref:BadF/BadG/BcrA/BcrD ATPase family protein n=1 Tax=Nitratireductor kimnyeongensis TaxID=430679 RepID=A0ABW0T716_9HYPH|nr:N-acetylglucosamine kinase [Nitratireductor kimnyeongensis]QZZ36375.1 N-acetylglucosamine kinase [Nitratireductor kimnyeongensis]
MSGHVIAIDGGGTSCRAALADAEGRVLGRGKRGSANIFTTSDTIGENIAAAAREAVCDAGLEGLPLKSIPAFLGLAGINVGERQRELAKALPFADTKFVHDGVIALQGALGDEDGVIAILGTGSVYLSRAGGVSRSIGGWGFAIGDQASGAVIGRALLQQALLAHDGVREHTPLSRAVMKRFEGNPEAMVEFAQQTARPADYGAFAPLMFEHDEKGDVLARDILLDAVRDITMALDAIVFEGCERLCLLGGLAGEYRKRLSPRHSAILQEPRGDALSGAVQLALRAFPPQAVGENG